MLMTNFTQCGFTGGRENCFDMLDCFSQIKEKKKQEMNKKNTLYYWA